MLLVFSPIRTLLFFCFEKPYPAFLPSVVIYVTDTLNIAVFRYPFATNRWLREATMRRRIPNTESCGFVLMNGELYVLRSAKVPVEASGPWRQLKKKLALEFQVYNPGTKKWRVLTTHPPVDAPIDFRTAALCTVEL